MHTIDPQLRIVQLERELQWAQWKIQVLEERLRQQRIRLLGPHSETLSNLQLELLAVDARDAWRQSSDRAGLLKRLEREGIDTSFVKRHS